MLTVAVGFITRLAFLMSSIVTNLCFFIFPLDGCIGGGGLLPAVHRLSAIFLTTSETTASPARISAFDTASWMRCAVEAWPRL